MYVCVNVCACSMSNIGCDVKRQPMGCQTVRCHSAPTKLAFQNSEWSPHVLEDNTYVGLQNNALGWQTQAPSLPVIIFSGATPNAIYTQQGAKPAWQEDINTKFSHLRMAQQRNLHTARRQTRMAGRHQHQIFASPHGTATQFTHSKAPNPNGRKTSTPNFRISDGTVSEWSAPLFS